ncbi:MAG: DegT/DnrJ/EryC1/StrS family aminotransferase [Synechococcales cyanobacterium M58_A2018_015]|nr:DegT/DnrJ/EryC1/StrS family aminotransferase [Synechococcales cyanobacterium M58_A2018_015]
MWCKRVSSIPAFELSQQFALIGEDLGDAVLEVLASGRYIGGAAVEGFEQRFADYIGTAYCISCNSGTDALYLALRSLEIGPGDEVITSPFTFFATAEMISAVGATPVFVDIEPQTFNLDLNQLEAAITPRTKAILPVHLFGQPVDMTRVMAIAQSHNLWVIEDCAQATGAMWGKAKVGSIGHIGCFSFYPTKNLGACGDGGAITTQDAALAAKLRMLRDHGQRQRYVYEEIGMNSRLDAVQAVILQLKLCHLDAWNRQRQAIAARYQQFLAPIPSIGLPQSPTGGEGVWNQYTIRVHSAPHMPCPGEQNPRDVLRQQLQQHGIGSMIYYPVPLHLQPVYRSLGYQPGQLPVAEQMAREVLSLPMFPELSATQQEQVVYALKESLSQCSNE